MKRILYIQDTPANKISYYFLLLFLISLPFDRFYSELLLAGFLVHTLVHPGTTISDVLKNKKMWILQSVFFLSVVGVCYSSFKKDGLNDITKQAAIFIFPLLFSLTRLDLAKYKKSLLLTFSLTCTLVIIYLYLSALYVIYSNHLPIAGLFDKQFINSNFSMPIGIHVTYLAAYVFISFSFFLSQVISNKIRSHSYLYIICMVILFIGLIQLGSKTIFLTLFFTINFVFPFFIADVKKRRLFVVLATSISLLTLIVVYSAPTFKTRYVNGLREDLGQHDAGEIQEPRARRWVEAVDLIKESPVIGHGTGSEIPLLKERYFDSKLYLSYLNNFNAHNQYLSITITTGIIGLLIFLYTLYGGFSLSIKEKDLFFICFMVLISILSCSENILSINKGIFFYSFFFSLQSISYANN